MLGFACFTASGFTSKLLRPLHILFLRKQQHGHEGQTLFFRLQSSEPERGLRIFIQHVPQQLLGRYDQSRKWQGKQLQRHAVLELRSSLAARIRQMPVSTAAALVVLASIACKMSRPHERVGRCAF